MPIDAFCRWPRLLACVGLVLGVTVAARSAAAQGPDDERARTHFEAGRSHFDQGSYERALPEFEAAYALSPRPALLFNLGTTLERLGQHEAAADHFERFLAETPEYDGRTDLESRIANLRRRAAIANTPAPDGAEEASDDGLLFAGIGLLGGAAAAAIVAGVLGGMALAEEDAARTGCFVSRTCTPEAVQSIDDLALGSDISWIAAGALGVAGGVLLIMALLGEDEPSEAARIVPFGSPDGGGVSMEGQF